ncbi:MAG: serine/threonine-protein kinase [Nocardioides sp.]|uniref:serine/threonine-protein kinase n=1 Tax=Nocardioides sp. TaxID=35761 RepID=UPI003F0FA092
MGEVFARRYELLFPIAEGGMGSVWKVLDHVDGQVKVAKLLRQRDAGALLRFMREQATRIHHPHVVTPLSWVGEDDTILFTMPLVRGGSVTGLVRSQGPLPEQWVVAILEQTLEALAVVHDAGVVHRDVKPANLLLEPTGRERPFVRLTDFGIAGVHGEPRLTGPSVAIGTPGYMAPEQQYGANPHPTQDLHGVAATGVEMLTGKRPPFADADIPRTPLGEVLRRGLSHDAHQRPASARAMREELLALAPAAWDPGSVTVTDQFADQPGHGFAGPTTPHSGAGSGSGPRPTGGFTGPGTGPRATGPQSGSGSGPRSTPVMPAAAFAGTGYGAPSTAGSAGVGMPVTLIALGAVLLLLGLWLMLG